MVIYIGGPMRGIANYNFPAFDVARDRLQALGHTVISPADLDRQDGIHENSVAPNIRQCILRDLYAIADRAEAIALLPGWQNSRGVAVEVAFAKLLALRILDAQTLEEIK